MRVSNRFLYYQLVNDINESTEKMFKLNGQISSGKRIDSPSEDPLGLANVLIYRTELNELDEFKKSIDMANGWLSSTDSILQDTDDLLSRAAELAVQHASATSNNELRQGAAAEIKEIRHMVLSHANAKYGNKYMFGGTQTQTSPFINTDIENWLDNVGIIAAAPPGAPADGDRYIDTDDDHIYQYNAATTNWVDQGLPADGASAIVDSTGELYVYTSGQWLTQYQGNSSTFSIKIGKESPEAINLPGDQVFTDSIMTLMRLEKALKNNDLSGIQNSLGELEYSSKVVMNNLARIGAKVNRLDHTKTVHERSIVDKKERISLIEDLDYAEAITSLQNQQTIYQATLKSSALITQMSLVDFV